MIDDFQSTGQCNLAIGKEAWVLKSSWALHKKSPYVNDINIGYFQVNLHIAKCWYLVLVIYLIIFQVLWDKDKLDCWVGGLKLTHRILVNVLACRKIKTRISQDLWSLKVWLALFLYWPLGAFSLYWRFSSSAFNQFYRLQNKAQKSIFTHNERLEFIAIITQNIIFTFLKYSYIKRMKNKCL